MTKKELIEMIKDLPDNAEIAVRSPMGTLETNFKIIRIYGGLNHQRLNPIDYLFESINNERDEK